MMNFTLNKQFEYSLVLDFAPEIPNSGETRGFNDQPWITLGQVSTIPC